MTVFYTSDVSNGESALICLKLLKRWKGSLYKLIWLDLLIFLAVYYALNILYRFVLNDSQKRAFNVVVYYCQTAHSNIPFWFLLGFFVSRIISRWFFSYTCIPWLNKTAMTISAHIDAGNHEGARKIRLTMMRYVVLSWILLMRLISDQTADRFPEKKELWQPHFAVPLLLNRSRKRQISHNLQHPWTIGRCDIETGWSKRLSDAFGHIIFHNEVNSGGKCQISPDPALKNSAKNSPFQDSSSTEPEFTFGAFHAFDDYNLTNTLRSFNDDAQIKATFGLIITENEVTAFQNVAESFYARTKEKYLPEYWIPLQWAQRLVLNSLSAGYIQDLRKANELLKDLMDLRGKMQFLQLFNSIIIPLGYSQVVTIAVYSYFLCQVFADQITSSDNKHVGSRDLYVPLVGICSVLFLMGWYKVALCVINPFGDDDEDFNVNAIFDYNLEVSYRTVYMRSESFPAALARAPTISSDADAHKHLLDEFTEQVHQEAMNNHEGEPWK